MRAIVIALGLAASSAWAISPAQCRAGCRSELKPQCEAACRKNAKKSFDACLKELCEVAMKSCDKMCETPPKRK